MRHSVAGRQLLARRSRAAPPARRSRAAPLLRRLVLRRLVLRRLLLLRDPHAPAVHAPTTGPDQDRALLADQPDAQPAALERQPGRRKQVALGVSDEVAEQPQRHPLGATGRVRPPPRAALASDRHHLARAAARLDPRDRPRVREADRCGREGQGLDREQQHPGDAEHGDDPGRPGGPPPPIPPQRRLARVLAPVKARRLVEAVRDASGRRRLGCAHLAAAVPPAQPPAIGRRSTTSSASSGSLRTTSAVPSS